MKKQECYFELSEEQREWFIENEILYGIAEGKEDLKFQITAIVEKYHGHDIDTLSLLHRARIKGRLAEFVERLEGFYKEKSIYISPSHRSMIRSPYYSKIKDFLHSCEKELGSL